jgi:hypothetical protein
VAHARTELVHTVRDLFAKARHPERVSVGICWQWRPDQDQPHVDEFDRFLRETRQADAGVAAAATVATATADRQRAVRIAWVDWREARGPCHARRVAQALYANERFHLALDSHMRFIPGYHQSPSSSSSSSQCLRFHQCIAVRACVPL